MMRYHPLTILYRIYQFVKNNLIIALLLFVIKRDSDFWLFEYGRYAFLVIVVWRLIYIVWSWFYETYEWEERTFYLKEGIFTKNTSSIPFSKIQNVTRQTTIFHKVFRLTSITFETAMDGVDDAITFEVVSKKHADFLLKLVEVQTTEPDETNLKENQEGTELDGSESDVENPDPKIKQDNESKVVHFTPTKRDLWKASFLSFSYLAFIPLLGGLFDEIQSFLPEEKELDGLLDQFLASKWLILLLVVVGVAIAVAIGVTRTMIRYGKYEISSNNTHIFINRGVLNESYFSIEKQKVQGLEITQSFLKRIVGLAEVKLVSSVNPNSEQSAVDVNSLYPFLPMNQAHELIQQLLPGYHVESGMKRLPRKSLWIKLLRPSWFWLLATGALFYFKPRVFGLESAWWIISVILFVWIYINRILDYVHTQYLVTNDQLQWRRGGLTSRLFITKRQKVIEMSISQSFVQKKFHVASLSTVNRSSPIHVEGIEDVPVEFATSFHNWYLERHDEVQYHHIP
ncbi:PH domain-containing protein [Aquibacillus kalidii]|uniref:PH domain-containing protein n=1 Tax=Aquibacillus kalidii TaxID=2762597 RepID=UPI001F19C57E|nr:PH domain-containing protein [Aquibacillus kalidii]